MKNTRRKFLRNRVFPTVKGNANLSHALKFGELMSTGENERDEMTDILCRERREGSNIWFYDAFNELRSVGRLMMTGEFEVLGKNQLQCTFVHYKFQMNWLGMELGPPQWQSWDMAWAMTYSTRKRLSTIYISSISKGSVYVSPAGHKWGKHVHFAWHLTEEACG